MKNKKDDKALRGLFEKKLRNAEIIPDPGLRSALMTRLGRREFLHFIPGRFNIWYAGIIAVAAAALTLMVFVHRDRSLSPVTFISNQPGPAIANPKTDEKAIISIEDRSFTERRVKPTVKPSITKGAAETAVQTGSDNPALSINSEATGHDNAEILKAIQGNGVFKGLQDKNELMESALNEENPIIASSTEGCIPFRISFRSVLAPVDSCLWTFGDGGSSSSDKPEWLFDQAGEYKVTLQAYINNVRHTGSVIILAHPAPEALFEIRPEDAVLPQDEIRFINYSADGVKYNWTFGDGKTSEQFEPVHSYKRSGKYDISLVVSSMFGCTDTMVIRNAFGVSQYFINFPNAFIPNDNGPAGGYYSNSSDQEASIFHPVFSGVSEYQLRIFSRRGLLIFESNDINIGWDGYYRNQLCENGVYIWKLRGTFLNGETFTKMGDVTLLKK